MVNRKATAKCDPEKVTRLAHRKNRKSPPTLAASCQPPHAQRKGLDGQPWSIETRGEEKQTYWKRVISPPKKKSPSSQSPSKKVKASPKKKKPATPRKQSQKSRKTTPTRKRTHATPSKKKPSKSSGDEGEETASSSESEIEPKKTVTPAKTKAKKTSAKKQTAKATLRKSSKEPSDDEEDEASGSSTESSEVESKKKVTPVKPKARKTSAKKQTAVQSKKKVSPKPFDSSSSGSETESETTKKKATPKKQTPIHKKTAEESSEEEEESEVNEWIDINNQLLAKEQAGNPALITSRFVGPQSAVVTQVLSDGVINAVPYVFGTKKNKLTAKEVGELVKKSPNPSTWRKDPQTQNAYQQVTRNAKGTGWVLKRSTDKPCDRPILYLLDHPSRTTKKTCP